MFDPVSEAVIKGARPLSGLDPNTLSSELTRVYIEIAGARLSSSAPDAIHNSDGLATLVERLSRLAATYEGQIILGLNKSFTRSMAFVAASARQAITQAAYAAGQTSMLILNEHSLGSALASSILFLIAERSSDASEAAKNVVCDSIAKPYARAVAKSIQSYARGELQSLISIASSLVDTDLHEVDPGELLFREILQGLLVMASVGLGQSSPSEIEHARRRFRTVAELAVQTSRVNLFGQDEIAAHTIFGASYQIASLFLIISEGFSDSAVVLLQPPLGSDSAQWESWVRTEASRSPFLWETHREAIALGYLDIGNSLVMTTPTGSGKTTLACLKIAATLTSGKSVLYLAPTHALVSQVEKDLTERLGQIETAKSIEDISLDDDIDVLPPISVVTPERCFALLSFAPEIFSNIGLLVFDECHLLGAGAKSNATFKADRRSVDAMLCLLTFIDVNGGADCLLLSAMINNGEEVASWIQSLLLRPVFCYASKWKPTRQLRSCVVYRSEELRVLENGLRAKPVRGEAKPAAVPYGIFSLESGWNPGSLEKLSVKPLTSRAIPLGVGKGKVSRYLTANRNDVAACIALSLALRGIKVIIFCDSVTNCVSIANAVNKVIPKPTQRHSLDRDKWRTKSLSEVGQLEAMYDSGSLCAAVHHGELLPEERALVESYFKDRESGVNVLAATSTLAQGLNLPCEVVVVAGTDRLDDSDPEEKKRVSLMPHELLNAMGRAGRAGQAALGLSIVVPGTPVKCSFETMDFDNERDLEIIFAPDDQCLPLKDPLETLFDEIEVSKPATVEAQYLLRRLAVSLRAAEDTEDSFAYLARRTFGFYQKNRKSSVAAEGWVKDRQSALVGRLSSIESVTHVDWIDQLAAKTGASPSFIKDLAENFDKVPMASVSAEVWLNWLLDRLDDDGDDFDVFLRPETMVRVFGRAITSTNDVKIQRVLARESIRNVAQHWFRGRTLIEIEKIITEWIAALEVDVKRPTTVHAKIKRARRFVLRVAPDLAFLAGILVQVGRKICEERAVHFPRILQFLPQLIRKGLATPYHYAIAEGGTVNRVQAFLDYSLISQHVSPNAADDWPMIAEKIRVAKAMAAFGAGRVI